MADVAAEETPPEGVSEEPVQRTILYAKGSSSSRPRRLLAVPNWFDLPVILPESHVVGARIQRNLVTKKPQVTKSYDRSQKITPKVSRLSTREEEDRKTRKLSQDIQKKTLVRRRDGVRRLDGLNVDRSWLREKLRRDLSRYGLWPMAGPEDMVDQQSVESAVDAIWTQWEKAEPLSRDIGERGLELRLDGSESRTSVFLTDATSMLSASTPGGDNQVALSRRESEVLESEVAERPEDDDRENELEEEDAPSSFLGSQGIVLAKVQTPGLNRRKRLTDLHRFVGTQLRKRLFRSWDTIEIAFSGSGEMTVSQIVKFLQFSDIQLGEIDAAKVRSILDEHVATVQEAQDEEYYGESLSENQAKQKRNKNQSTLLSYENFRQLFHPVDPQEASRWKREFDRDKFRQKQEKEIYSKELAALEEKVRQRLATSAKQMVDILYQFKTDPNSVPWENEAQRLHLRAQFLDVIFRKPNRRRILQLDNRLPNSGSAQATSLSSVPEKLSVKLVLSMLLQKYSRNGHFESIEVPVAAYLYHDIAMDIVKQSIRRVWEKAEIDQWPERQIIFRFRMKKQTFHDWRTFAERMKKLREHVLRKFVAWKYMTRKLHEHYAFYRISFWPFHVWKRHLQQMIIARGKATFLVNAWHTYVQLRNFRALKQRYKRKQWNQRQIGRLRKKKARKVRTICWETWKDKSEGMHLIRQIWKTHGHMLQQLHKFYMVRITFYLLRYYSILKRDMKRRKYKSFLALYSVGSRAKLSSPQHKRQPLGVGSPHRGAQQTDPHQHGRTHSVEIRNSIRGSVDITGGLHRASFQQGDPQADLDDGGAATSLTRIMETELGAKIKRKSRLYDVCLTLYLKYRERDRSNMIGNVVAYRRFGRVFMKNMKAAVRHNKRNRLATDLGAFRILQDRFQQWMISSLYKVPPTQDGNRGISTDHNEQEEAENKVVLNWRLDREWRLQSIAENPHRAQKLRDALLSIMENDSVRKETIRGRELLLRKKQTNEDTFLRNEAGATLKIKAAQMQHVQQIMRRRAHRLHDAMDNIYNDLLDQQARQQLRSSFRSLRIAMMMRHTDFVSHRAQIRNWLRICHRFTYLNNHMDKFYKMKKMYHAFQTLLRHAVWKWKLQSPELSEKLQRSQLLMWQYEHYLEQHGLFDGSPQSLHLAGTKFSPANTFKGVLLRWMQFTQSSKARRAIINISHRKQQIWLLYSVFYALKNRVKAKYTYLQRCAQLPYLWRQSMVDLDTYHCKIVALEARLPTAKLKAKLKHSHYLMKQAAARSPTLKKLFQDHEKEVRQRLQLEKRLMLAAFHDRAVHNFTERGSVLFGMAAGRPFIYEKAPPFSSITEIAIICSKKVDGISVVVKANSAVSVEGTLHGNPFGTREVFSLSRGEKLTAVEGFASQSVYGLRFGTSSGRLSKWFGHCEKGTKFEISSDFLGKREEIIGVFGHADGASINSIGVVMRHTIIKNPFEGLWVHQDHHSQQSPVARDEVALSDRQFAYFLQVRSCEVMLAMQRAHAFAMEAYRLESTLPPPLGNLRIIMSLARWMVNALSHGLVHCTDREEEGKQFLQNGLDKRAAGESLLAEGVATMRSVDSFRDAEGQLDAATLGVKKIVELREMFTQAQQKIAEGEKLKAEADTQIMLSQRILPHLPGTTRMITAIRKMYKVVQTKDEIDQMNPELRAILLLKRSPVAVIDGPTA